MMFPQFSTPTTRRMVQAGREMEAEAAQLPWFRFIRRRNLMRDARDLRLAGALGGGTLPPDPRTWRKEREVCKAKNVTPDAAMTETDIDWWTETGANGGRAGE